MSDTFYSTVKGANKAADVAVAASTGSGSVELRVTDGALTKIETLLQLEAIKQRIEQNAQGA